MPIFDYKCDFCGATIELMTPMNSSEDTIKCDGCESGYMHKQLGAPMVLNGGTPKFHPNNKKGK